MEMLKAIKQKIEIFHFSMKSLLGWSVEQLHDLAFLNGFIDATSFLASTDILHFLVRKVKAGANFLDQQHFQHCVGGQIGYPCLHKPF